MEAPKMTLKEMWSQMDYGIYNGTAAPGCTCASCTADRMRANKKLLPVLKELRMKLLKDAEPRTQKAKGLKAIWMAGKADYHITATTFLIQEEFDLPATLPFGGTWFARPCPTRPRPGFVESRVVKNAQELATVYEETRAEDPLGEVLLMPFVDATMNVCITPGLMSIGPGHDGATAGKDARAFPINASGPAWLAADAVAATIAKGEVPHCEVVLRSNAAPLWVQARSGPAAPSGVGADYVPEKVDGLEIEKVVEVGDTSMLEWEAIAKTMTPGQVAYGKGHTMGSHAALHCLASGVPFFTSRRPKVGEVLKATPPPSWDLEAIIEGIGAGLMTTLPTTNDGYQRQQCLAILYGLHHASALQGNAGFYLGYAGALMLRFGMSAGEGELGINNDNAPYQCNGTPNDGTFCSYQNVISRPFKTLGIHRDFLVQHCESHFLKFNTSGISGQNWGRCVYSLFALDRALQSIVRSKGANGKNVGTLVDALIIALNKAVDQAHNGAWWLNKFGVQSQDFEAATKGEWDGLVGISKLLYELEKGRTALLMRRRRMATASWYGAMKSLQPPTMTVSKAFVKGRTLYMEYKWPHTAKRDYCIPVKVGVIPEGDVKVRRAMKDTRLDLIFYIDGPEGAIDLHTVHFELELDPRKAVKAAATMKVAA